MVNKSGEGYGVRKYLVRGVSISFKAKLKLSYSVTTELY